MGLLSKIGKIAGGIIGGPVGAAIGGVAGSLIGGKKGKKAAGIQASSYDAAAAAQREALGRAQGYQLPYQNTGIEGINALTRLNSGDYSSFYNSPDYVYARDEALRGVEGGAAARGGLYSGNAGRRLAEVAGWLASKNLGAYRDSVFRQIGIGQGAANTLTNADMGTAGNVGNALIGAADARASGVVAKSNGLTNTIDQVAGIAGDYSGSKIGKKKPVGGANSLYGVNLRQRQSTNAMVG